MLELKLEKVIVGTSKKYKILDISLKQKYDEKFKSEFYLRQSHAGEWIFDYYLNDDGGYDNRIFLNEEKIIDKFTILLFKYLALVDKFNYFFYKRRKKAEKKFYDKHILHWQGKITIKI